MTYQPVLPATGLLGWKFLERTIEAQSTAFESSAVLMRDTDYFAENVSNIETAEELVADRKLLRVALGAFGLDDDLNNKFFIRKILEEGTIDPSSLANKMSDSRYTALSEAFGFDLGVPRSKLSDFADDIIGLYRARQFEVAVGENDQNIRLALNAQRELPEIAASDDSETTRWYNIMSSSPLRSVMETALGLPDSFAQIDLDQQLEIFAEKAERQLGIASLSDLSDAGTMTKLIERFLLRAEINTGFNSSPASIALTLLQSR